MPRLRPLTAKQLKELEEQQALVPHLKEAARKLDLPRQTTKKGANRLIWTPESSEDDVEQTSNESVPPTNRTYSLILRTVAWTLVVALVGGLGFYCVGSIREQNARDAEKERLANEKRETILNEEKNNVELAINSYQEFVRTEFPGWALEG